ncbi:MAG: ankyrin repeat domain-containing protein, partial [Rhodoferax sp.]|nr:ankyrin repeat domain-containing protein [Rhodoferax sp.]
MSRQPVLRAALAAAVLGLATGARAQVPPSADEARAYRGLHAAAQKGDVQAIAGASAAALQARDARGR